MASLGERLHELHPRVFFLETWETMNEEAAEEREARRAEGKGYDYRPVIVMAVATVMLTLMEYWGGHKGYYSFLAFLEWGSASFDFHPQQLTRQVMALYRNHPWFSLSSHAWWAAWRVLGFFIVPALAVKLMKEDLGDQGLSMKGFREHLWIYGLGFLVVLVCVVVVSHWSSYNTYYPFYRLSSRSWTDFLAWELMYFAQFFSLEFFFRGWWLKACKSSMGSAAIFMMVVPYVMIHFGKPMTETLGAIFAGLFLGTLAMKTRSIWSGFLIHVSVAVSMDLASLIQTDRLPTELFPAL